MAAGRRKKVWGVEFSVVRSQMFVVVCLHLQEAAEQIYSHLQTEVKLKKHKTKRVQTSSGDIKPTLGYKEIFTVHFLSCAGST